MILKICFLLMLCVAWEVSGASFSKVFVQTGPEVAPTVEYLPYGAYSAPAFSYGNSQIAQYVAAPVGLEYASGYNYGIQCTTTACFYPEQQAPVAPVAPSANIVKYIPALSEKIESVPMVYSSGHNVPGYEYAYVIVDDNNREHSAYRELSDGGILRGEYAFIQPDGHLHELPFNAVVESIMPHEHSKSALPCVQSEELTELESSEEHHEEIHEGHEEHEARHGDHEDHVVADHEEEKEDGAHENQESSEVEAHEHEEPSHEAHENHEHESHEDHTHEKLIEGSGHRPEPHEHGEPQHHESHHQIHYVNTEHDIAGNNVYISYNDVIKCIQAAMAKVNSHHSSIPRVQSPLTYLVFNKPC